MLSIKRSYLQLIGVALTMATHPFSISVPLCVRSHIEIQVFAPATATIIVYSNVPVMQFPIIHREAFEEGDEYLCVQRDIAIVTSSDAFEYDEFIVK